MYVCCIRDRYNAVCDDMSKWLLLTLFVIPLSVLRPLFDDRSAPWRCWLKAVSASNCLASGWCMCMAHFAFMGRSNTCLGTHSRAHAACIHTWVLTLLLHAQDATPALQSPEQGENTMWQTCPETNVICITTPPGTYQDYRYAYTPYKRLLTHEHVCVHCA